MNNHNVQEVKNRFISGNRQDAYDYYLLVTGSLKVPFEEFCEVMERKYLHRVKVTFGNGDHLTTRINGSIEEVHDYYKKGRYFNLGVEGDNMQPVTNLEFLTL